MLLGCLMALTACSSLPTAEPLASASSPPLTQTSIPTASITPGGPTPTLSPLRALLATREAQLAQNNASRLVMPPESLTLSSPDGQNEILFGLINGRAYYSVRHGAVDLLLPSALGFTFKGDTPLQDGLVIIGQTRTSFDETWTQPWGEVKNIRDQHNELRVHLMEQGPNAREFFIVFRAFNDGIGFRYEFPAQAHLKDVQITEELTEFSLTGDHSAWWIPALQPNRYEYLYQNTPVSLISRSSKGAAHTPLTMQTSEGLFLSFHEAALVNYASMTLKPDNNLVLHASLVPWSDGIKVKTTAPFKTPWRTLQIASTPGELITSYLILNLNEPNKLGDVSWVKPQKYIGIWWGMHLGKWTWASGAKHGATTANTREYLAFAAKNGFDGVLVEGWNTGWDGNWYQNGSQFSFTQPYPDYDLPGLASYAHSLGVRLIGHNETAVGIANYEKQMEEAFALYQKLGINTIKTGYVSDDPQVPRLDANDNLLGMEYHHGQFMVNHYQKVIETAARYGIMIDAHEPIKDTGLRRTYPNFLSREGARGQEYNAWGANGGNPPDHVTILPFTRLLAGPMDYTPGILALTYPEYKPANRINHTLSKELALYVVIYSPLQMAADLIENYENNPAFQFIKDVPVDWNETRVLHAQIGDYITTVRQERDGEEWFLGAITDENSRELPAPLDFLTPGVKYVAQIYADAPGADWQSNPYAISISSVLVDSNTTLQLKLAPGGGQAIRFYPASASEATSLPNYQP